jgi:hypothetical protein
MENIGKLVALGMFFMRSASGSDALVGLKSPLLWGFAGVVTGVFLFFRGFPYLQRKRVIENTPTSTVRGAPLGAVEMSGRVVGPYTLISPISESDCFYYRAVARSSSKEDKSTIEETLYAPFFIDDGTGLVLVDPRGAEMELQPFLDQEYSPSAGDAFIRRFLVRRGLSSEFPATLQEYCIRAGDHLFVMGTLRENTGLESAADCLAAGLDQEKQGFLSGAAADLQRAAAIEAMLPPGGIVRARPKLQPEKTEAFDLNPPVVLMRGVKGEPFFISWRSERDVIGQLALRSILYVWGGPIISLVGVWLLVSNFFGS